ncbi:MAG: PAS domain S-box protein [Deltaproteobacteria bacterium]|nr:PAS domain S-box protein [Deltaproteobacteria bacterium]
MTDNPLAELTILRERVRELARENAEWRQANERLQHELTRRHSSGETPTEGPWNERVGALEALRESEMRFRDLYENAPNAYFSVGRDGFIRMCNRRAGELLGYPPADLVGRPVTDLYADTPQGKEKAGRILRRFQAGESVRDEELEMQKADGSPLWISLTVDAVRDAQGQVVESRSLVVDITERKRAEALLRQAHQDYEILVNSIDGIVWQADPQTFAFSFVSRQAERLLGYPAERWLTEPAFWINHLHADDREWAVEYCTQAVREGRDHDFEYQMLAADGRVVWLRDIVTVVVEQGLTTGLRGIMVDVTERKGAEEALKQAEERYRRLFANAAEGIFLSTPGGRYLSANQALAEIHGYDSPEELIAAVADIRGQIYVHPEERIRFQNQLAAQGPVRGFLTEVYRRDGSKILVSINARAVRDAKGVIEHYEGSVEDITERKRYEEILHRANETLRATLEAAPVAIIDLDLEGRVKSIWNAAAEQLLGWSRDEVLGKFLPTVDEEHAEEFALFRSWIRSGKSFLGKDVVRRRKDGSPIEYSIYAAPEYDAEGRAIGNIAVLVDITERRRAEEEIRRLNLDLEQRVKDRTAQLEEANRDLEGFVYSISHDLRAPLRHIDGFIDQLRQGLGPAVDDRSRRYMTKISLAANRMGTLIDDLLSFARMGRHEMTWTEVALGELVQEVIAEMGAETEGRRIHWQINELPLVRGDRAMLRVVLVNLIANALKFTRGREPAEIEIGCRPEAEKEVVVFVRDNGVGFEMKYADKLFGVFQRLHRAEEFEGTGIGLANVRRIIRRHGGRTWAEGQEKQGATFYFSLRT